MGRFQPGSSGNPRGRPKGLPKSVPVRELFTEAFERLGGIEALVAWGRENPGEFFRELVRLQPKEQKVDLSGSKLEIKL